MAADSKMTELVQAAEAAFGLRGPVDPAGCAQLLSGLYELLAHCDGWSAGVMDVVWNAAKQLQAVLTDGGKLNPDTLAGIYQQLQTAEKMLHPDDPAPAAPAGAAEPAAYRIPEDDIPLVADFINEASEHLDAAEAAMLTLENQVDDADALNLIFRSVHTIKGMAGFMNLEQIGLLAHDAENLLDRARKGAVLLTGEAADAVFRSIDMLKTMIGRLRVAIAGDGTVPVQAGIPELIAYLQRCAEKPAGSAAAPAAPAPVEPVPVPEVVPGEAPPAAEPLPAGPAKIHGGSAEEKIKVSTSRLDCLVDMVGELVIAQLMVAESLRTSSTADYELLRNTAHQEKIIRELQELAMAMRMVPVGGIFQRMARMTRDLSRRAGKEVELVMEGEHTELDRTIVDKLADPLIHMIRNSVDHGIESPGQRVAAGKPAVGQIQLRASHAAGCIVIQIADDGRGLDREKLLEKAVSRGVFAPGKTPTDQELFHIIFLPGLSTAAEVTSISGRGVGMDVVKRNIEELRGRIDIASTPGQGTVFTITLPLTLAIIDGQIVRVGQEKYIIPINGIRRSFRPEPGQISTVQGRREMVLVREELLPLVRLHRLFDIEPDSTVPSEGLIVIVEEDNEACCLLVDDLLDQQQVVIKGLGPMMGSAVGISGGAIMGDGKVRLILDIPGLMKLFRT